MKHLNLLFILLIISTATFAQNVGIGLTNPAAKLHIDGNVRVDGRSVFFGPDQRIYGDNASAFYFDGNHATISQIILRDADNTAYGRLYGGGDGRYFGLLDGDANWSYIADKDVYTGFRIDNSEKMRINANGHVGIGTTSPAGKLTVVVDTLSRGLTIYSADGSSHLPYSNGYSYLAGKGIIFRTTAANTERVRITPGGRMGVGTASPAHQLHITGNARLDGRTLFFGAEQTLAGDNSSALYFDGSHSTVSRFTLRDKENAVYGSLYGSGDGANFGLLDGDGHWGLIQAKDNYTSFRINNAEKMRIRGADGFVGINTTNPSHMLHVNSGSNGGLVVVNDNGNTHIPWTNGWSYLSGAGVIFRTSNNSERMRISPNGNVGIGTTNPTSKLAVNGNVRSKEVLVELSNWPDYVFDDSYQLPTLIEEESFINENGHLSGFKSEAEMEGTITVGDVTKRQQEKIEQIMLHLIKMEKDNEAMKSEMKSMETEMEGMGTKMKSMESKISELTEENQKLKAE